MICLICSGEDIITISSKFYFCRDCGEKLTKDEIIFDVVDKFDEEFNIFEEKEYE